MLSQKLSNDDLICLVLDNGSGYVKYGFGGDSFPRSILPCVVGSPKQQNETHDDYVVGEDALAQKEFMDLIYPLQRGIVTDWNRLSKIWHRCFYHETMGSPQESGVVITCSVFTSNEDKEKMTEILFETYEVPGLIMCNTATLSAIQSGKTTAMILNCGHHTIEAVPVVDLKPLTQAAVKIDQGGYALTQYMQQLFSAKGHSISHEEAEEIKINGYIALDYQTALQKGEPAKSYSTAHGKIDCGNERFQCPEALFQPTLAGYESLGIHELVFDSVAKCDKVLQKALMECIVPCGGSSTFTGLSARLQKELTSLVPSDVSVNVLPVTTASRYSSWVGASMLTTLKISEDMWLSRDEYFDVGPPAILKKCW